MVGERDKTLSRKAIVHGASVDDFGLVSTDALNLNGDGGGGGAAAATGPGATNENGELEVDESIKLGGLVSGSIKFARNMFDAKDKASEYEKFVRLKERGSAYT